MTKKPEDERPDEMVGMDVLRAFILSKTEEKATALGLDPQVSAVALVESGWIVARNASGYDPEKMEETKALLTNFLSEIGAADVDTLREHLGAQPNGLPGLPKSMIN